MNFLKPLKLTFSLVILFVANVAWSCLKKKKVDPGVTNGSEDESESIVSELLERTESSLSQMTLSQSSSDDLFF